MKCVILHSGLHSGPEAETALPPVRADDADTLRQAEEAEECLTAQGIAVRRVAFNGDIGSIERRILQDRPDFIFNLVESVNGTDRLYYVAAALADYLGIPYSGCPAPALCLLADKRRARKIMQAAGLPVPAGFSSEEESLSAPERQEYIVKSATEHASFGLDAHSVVPSRRAALALIARRRETHGGEWYAEAFIDGREFNISVIGGADAPAVLPLAEIEFTGYPAAQAKVVNYAAKWDEDSIDYQTTRRVFPDFPAGDKLPAQLQALTAESWRLFGLRDYARVDFRVDAKGRPFIIEINPNPCLSKDSGLAAALTRAGGSPGTLIGGIIGRIFP